MNRLKRLCLVIIGSYCVFVFDPPGVSPQFTYAKESVQNNQVPKSLANPLVFSQPLGATNSDPGNRKGAGPRGPENLCSQTQGELTALVPGVERTQTSRRATNVLSVTLDPHPTFWFYSPYQTQGNLSGEFEIRAFIDGKTKRFHPQEIALSSTPGLFSVQLKEKPLAVDLKYQWILLVACKPGEPSANDSVTGWVQRVSNPELDTRLQQTKDVKQKIQLYARSGIWHETLTLVLKDLCRSEQHQAQAWFKDLMQSIGLADIANKPQICVRNHPKL